MQRTYRVLLYTLTGDTSFAQSYLEERGVADRIELVGMKHEAFTPPTAEQLEGIDAVCGEFMPVVKDTVDVFAQSSVRLIASMSIGLNHMDVARLTDAYIMVSNCPGYCAEDVALHATALTLDLVRKVTFGNREVLAGGWSPKFAYPSWRTSGRTLGLVFFGHIAKALVPMAKGLGMEVLVWAPTKSAEEIESYGAKKASSFEELLGSSDVVSLHCPLCEDTRDLMDAEAFSKMKPGAFFVNTARGECVDEEALLAALDSGQVAGAGLDTLCREATARNERLVNHPHVVVTPHSAYDSIEAAEELMRMSLDACIESLVEVKVPVNCVNHPAARL
jgi:D-3-phosphoglycerate dehydrogenase